MKAVKPLDVQESVSADSEAPDIMFVLQNLWIKIVRAHREITYNYNQNVSL